MSTMLPDHCDRAMATEAPQGLGVPAKHPQARPGRENLAENRLGALPMRSAMDQMGAVVTLDLGTATGWALRTTDGQIVSGTQSFKPGRYEGGGMRFLRFRAWLTELQASAGPISACYFEEVRRHAGVDAAHVYGGLMATLTAWCESQAIPYAGVPVGTIKKHATGKGNADKAAMVAAMQALGHRPGDDNEADALALLHWAMAQPGTSSSLEKS